MIVVMRQGASEEEITAVECRLRALGFDIDRSDGVRQTVLGAVGERPAVGREIEILPGVERVVRLGRSYRLAGRSRDGRTTPIQIGPVTIGGREIVVMAGPCSAETEEQVFAAARAVRRSGAVILRGGAFKPRTSPYSFQGLGEEGLSLLRRAADMEGLLLVTEVMDPGQLPLVADHADILQVGARNMQNFAMLRALGRIDKPVLLKRGFSATVEELLLASEYILHGGNRRVILCERGIRTFETSVRNTLDLTAIPVVHQLSHLPIVVDPSHATGLRDKVPPMALAAVAAGADGLLIEVHPDPPQALSDGAQQLYPEQFAALMGDVKKVAQAVGRTLTARPAPVAG